MLQAVEPNPDLKLTLTLTSMMLQAVEGVSFLHSKGVVHADVKSVSHRHPWSPLYAVQQRARFTCF